MRFRLAGMTGGLAVGVTAAVAIACAVGTWLYSTHHFSTLLAGARATALTQGELIRAGLEHQMLENDRTLIEQMIQGFGQEPQIERVMLLDREGQLRYSSTPPGPNVDLTLASPTCQACHRYPPEQRTSSRVMRRCCGPSSRCATGRPASAATTRSTGSTASSSSTSTRARSARR
jgi:hypothetical protein